MHIRSARSDNELIVGEDEHRDLGDPNKDGIFDRRNRDIFGLVRWQKFTIARRQVPETALGRKLFSIMQSTERDLKRKRRLRLSRRNETLLIPLFSFSSFFLQGSSETFSLRKRNRARDCNIFCIKVINYNHGEKRTLF